MDKPSRPSVRYSIAKSIIAVGAVAIAVLAGNAHIASARPVEPAHSTSIAQQGSPGEWLKVLQAVTRRAVGGGQKVWKSGRLVWKSPEMSDLRTSYKAFRKSSKPYCDLWHNAYVRAYGRTFAIPFWRHDSQRYPSSYAAGAYRICRAAAYTPIVFG